MKKLFPTLLICAFATMACKEQDLSEDNPPLPTENLRISTSFLLGGQGLFLDSMYTNNLGNEFFIESVKVLAGRIGMVTDGLDTIMTEEPFLFQTGDTDKNVLRIAPGGYTAFCFVQTGLDSLQSAKALTAEKKEGSPFLDNDIQRNPGIAGFGYNHIVIKGRVIDQTNPDDSTGTLPLSLSIGTYEFTKLSLSETFNFSVINNKDARFILSVDIGNAVLNRDLEARPTVVTDESDAADFNAATQIFDNILIQVF